MPQATWSTRRDDKARRLAGVAPFTRGKFLDTAAIVPALQALLRPGDRVALEGNNQKQADFLSRSLAQVDPRVVHDLHLLISSISRPEHLDLFERGIARKAGLRLRRPAERARRAAAGGGAPGGRARSIPTSSCTRACSSTSTPQRGAGVRRARPTPTATSTPAPTPRTRRPSSRPTAFRHGIVIAQVNEIVDELPRVDIPGSWVDLRGRGRPAVLARAAVHARPGADQRSQMLMAMMAIRGIYERHGVDQPQPRHRLRHRGDRAAAADLRRIARPQGQDLPHTGRSIRTRR